jgi:hypothetical protein
MDSSEKRISVSDGKLRTDPARGLAGGAAADGLPLDDEDVGDAARGEMVGDGAADDAAADDDHARGSRQAHNAGMVHQIARWAASVKP